jgi:hypothetical protein
MRIAEWEAENADCGMTKTVQRARGVSWMCELN